MEDHRERAKQLWNTVRQMFLTSHEEPDVENDTHTRLRNGFLQPDVSFHQRQPDDDQSHDTAECSHNIDILPDEGMAASSDTVHSSPPHSNTQHHGGTGTGTGTGQDFSPFVKATKDGNLADMKKFLDSHPEALNARLFGDDDSTALHYTLHMGKDREVIADYLVKHMKAVDLEIEDKKGFTPLAIAALHHHPKSLLESMVEKNKDLPNIGKVHRVLPVAVACWKGFTDTTQFLYRRTRENILSLDYKGGSVGVYLLHHCINVKLFDIASELVEKFPKILLLPYTDDGYPIYPVHAFAKTFPAFPSGGQNQKMSNSADLILKYVYRLPEGSKEENEAPNEEELNYIDEARKFLKLICKHLSEFGTDELRNAVDEAMIEAAKNGNIEFITEMLIVDSELILAEDKDGQNMFWHAVVNRQEKVFNLIYDLGDHKDSLLSHDNRKNNNILHCAAMLPPSSILDRISSPALQMQRELQWFKEVSNVAKTRYRGNSNKFKKTPRQLFTEQHKKLLEAAETSMKETAKAATTVGALIITTMFAAAFAVTGASNKTKTNPAIVGEMMLNIFVLFDALSLCSSISSIVVFLGILTSRYSEEEFLVHLPRRFIVGFYTLFTALATMMASFCFALAITLQGLSQLMALFVCTLIYFPIMLTLSSIFPLLLDTRASTYGPSIFDKSTKLPKSTRTSIRCCYDEEKPNVL